MRARTSSATVGFSLKWQRRNQFRFQRETVMIFDAAAHRLGVFELNDSGLVKSMLGSVAIASFQPSS